MQSSSQVVVACPSTGEGHTIHRQDGGPIHPFQFCLFNIFISYPRYIQWMSQTRKSACSIHSYSKLQSKCKPNIVNRSTREKRTVSPSCSLIVQEQPPQEKAVSVLLHPQLFLKFSFIHSFFKVCFIFRYRLFNIFPVPCCKITPSGDDTFPPVDDKVNSLFLLSLFFLLSFSL